MQSYDNLSEILPKRIETIGQHWNRHMEQEIQKKVLKPAKEQEKTLEEQTGVELHEWQQQQAEQGNIKKTIWLRYLQK